MKRKALPTSQSELSFQTRISRIYNHLYANAPVKTPSGIAYEFGKLAHSCLFLETKNKQQCAFSFSSGEERELLSGSTLFAIEVATTVRTLFNEMNSLWGLYADDPIISLSDSDIAYCIATLNRVWLSDPDNDFIGDIFEIIRSSFAKEKGGQFFTHPLITRLAMSLLDFDPLSGDDLVDPCAGTGGFLLAGVRHIEEHLNNVSANGQENRTIHGILGSTLRGLEIDPDAASTANGTLQARFGHNSGDTVRVFDSLRLSTGEIFEGIGYSLHQCVATNPPFGTKITIKDKNILANFELARISPRSKDTFKISPPSPRAPDILFLEECVKLLVPGEGRLAIVTPYQILSGPTAQYIRRWLLLNTELLAVVDLPDDTFQPHTGTKASLIVVRRRKTPLTSLQEITPHRVFMAAPKHIGHDRRGNPVHKISEDGISSTEILTDIPEIGDAYNSFILSNDPSKISSKCFSVSSSDITASHGINMNASYYKGNDTLADLFNNANSDKWNTVLLKDVVKDIHCPGRFKRHYVENDGSGVNFMGGSNINELFSSSNKYLSKSDKKTSDMLVEPGWILVTRSGSTGIISSVPKSWKGRAMSEHVIRVVPDDEKIPGSYVLTYLRSKVAQDYLKKGVFGSVINEITPEYLGKLPVLIPTDKTELDKISSLSLQAEKHRDLAIRSFDSCLMMLEETIGYS